MHGLTETGFQSRDFRPQGAKRTTLHMPVFLLQFYLLLILKFAIPMNPLQRRMRWRKSGVQVGAIFFPLDADRFLGQRRLGIKEVVKTSLLHPGALTNLINRRAAVGASPNQFRQAVHQPFFGVTDSAHKLIKTRDSFPATGKVS